MLFKEKYDYDEFLTMSRMSRNWETSLRDYSVKKNQPKRLTNKRIKSQFTYDKSFSYGIKRFSQNNYLNIQRFFC